MSFPPASPEELNPFPVNYNSSNTPLPPNLAATFPRHAATEPPSSTSRSCVTCRRRKVRCNKRSPCSNCTKAGIDCTFPPPGRAPRKSKRPPDAELLSRLRRLEGVIDHLRGNGDTEGGSTSTQAPPSTTGSSTVRSEPTAPTSVSTEPQNQVDGGRHCPFEASDPKKLAPNKFENEFGRLVIDEGRSRYVSNRLWTSLGDEIEELQDILDHSSSGEDDTPSPESSQSASHDGFLFGFYSLSKSLREFHPPMPKVSLLWETYQENVAPLVTIVHRPTARDLFSQAARNPDALDKNSEALVFSMYLCSIVSMKPDDCWFQFGEDRTIAVKRYRFATEQALAKAGFLNTQSLVLLQAAVLFLVCVRREDDSKFVWSMTSIVLRLAQSLGLHRDGSNFALKPYETEMRRRLWWHISLLDVRSSEDHGTDPLIHESMYDTLLPLNLNDDDLSPDMEEPPKEREGFTDVTFCLIRYRAGRMIQIISDRCEQRYIKHCDMNIPLQWCTATVGRLILAKLWLIVHHPMTRKERGNVSQATRESLFLTAIEVLEFGHLLETDLKTAKWGWLFRTNMQWHGIAFVLSEVCVRPICPITDRAWSAVSSIYTEWAMQATHKKGMLWRPLAALMKRAAATRSKHKEELISSFGPFPTATEPIQSINHNHTLPRIHMPIGMPNSPSIDRPGSTASDTDYDPSNGPLGALRNMFPGINILATSNDIFDAPPAQNNISAPSLPTSLPYNTTMINPFLNEAPLPDTTQLNWEEWDQVMRDFQMDVENDDSLPTNGNVAEWFA
ncbi:transcriptional regulator family: Fungal Specific TF [Penicillium roqueforti]|uniref:transcriptional regulator family: Fungal Specific TF n=1 Tax=Penicillium roqueforti TaxID=5082 RepID=UPI00190B9377|nr:transcriptional regulator family: Fungal Specific TF [Penicillium roqueforti]KAF9247554.1 transcriptional regulator family: Fungal Specific TF [Penicillium roqueforti]KAI1834894.1 transcriptional regulator family: Fungal Specific TF [Penicillium roqueforti]KAI2676735.1 transcriptional regulator family: Fungal Specific TF [Penicillium roqueforti]KAI2683610.1 transcriptional regulator family: Fungal Specific TF [Penicillium roqueforti]KAI2703052.1 transcriptional regulator family: Fungal Spec